MDKFEDLRAEILSKYPDIKTLPLYNRLMSNLWGFDLERTVASREGNTTYSMTAIIRRYQGVEYFKEFGHLRGMF